MGVSDTPYHMLPPGDVEPMCQGECRELNAHNQWRMKDQFDASLQAMDWWRQHERGNQLERELAKAKSRLDNVPVLLENNAKLRRELADAKKDTARLDWLDKQHYEYFPECHGKGTVRNCIDAAMEADK